MPSLIDLRRRIRAVKNTQQITKAMKMVAASKLRRAQERIMNARPYAVQMQRVLGSVASRVDPSIHPLLMTREAGPESRTLLIVVTADKGLCGSFNTNVIKAGATFLVEILKQPQYEPLAVERQVAIIYAGTNGYMDDVALPDVRAYETELYRFIESRYPQLFGGIRDKKQLDDELKPMLEKAVKEFTADFTARKSAAA